MTFLKLNMSTACGERIWPPPHRVYLNLDGTPESKWIVDIARQAQSVIQVQDAPLIPAHLDWGAKNCRFDRGQICVVYDWDSLYAASEAEMVGRAAAQFTAQWDIPAPQTPSPAEARLFVEEYENARGRKFSQDERAVLAAGADYIMAYIARQTIAAGVPAKKDSFLALLQKWGSGMLFEDR